MSNVPPIPPSREVLEYGSQDSADISSVLGDATSTFDAACEVPRCGWVSYGWKTKEAADLRLSEHYNEHETGNPTSELIESAAHQVNGTPA